MQLIVAETIAEQVQARLPEIRTNNAESIELVRVAQDGSTGTDMSQATALLRESIGRAGYRRVLETASNLKWIHTGSAGVEAWITPELSERRITLTNSAGVYAIPIAEWVLHALLMIVKRGPQMVAAQQARRWDSSPEFDELGGKTLTIFGAGGIGSEIARRAAAFDMRVWGTNRSGNAVPHVERIVSGDAWRDVLPETDFLVLAAPLTAATRHAIGARELAMLPPQAWLINIARGAIVDEPALIAALQSGALAGAALDTFEQEPLPADSPFWSMSNVIISPHHSGSSPRSMERVLDLFIDNLGRFVRAEALRNVVDVEAGY